MRKRGFQTGPTQTKLYMHRKWLEAGNFRFKKRRDSTICVAKTKVLISCAVTAQLICGFVFAYADCWFSDNKAQLHDVIKGQLCVQNSEYSNEVSKPGSVIKHLELNE